MRVKTISIPPLIGRCSQELQFSLPYFPSTLSAMACATCSIRAGFFNRSCATEMSQALLEVHGLTTQFASDDGIVRAIDDVSLRVDSGETVCLVGESGCRKTVTALSILKLIPMPPGKITQGQIMWLGRDLITLDPAEMSRIRGKEIGMVFQEPMTAL